jgi:protein TonB
LIKQVIMSSHRNLAVSLAVSIAVHGLAVLCLTGLIMVGASELAPVFRRGFSGVTVTLLESAPSEDMPALPPEIEKDLPVPRLEMKVEKASPAIPRPVKTVVSEPSPIVQAIVKQEESRPLEINKPVQNEMIPDEYDAEFDAAVEEYFNATAAEMVSESAVEKKSAETTAGDSMDKGVQAVMEAGSFVDIRPAYPLGARLRGEEGVVVVRVTVSQSGRADKIEVMKSSGYSSLDGSAVSALKKARFMGKNSAVMNGGEVTLPFRFKLVN